MALDVVEVEKSKSLNVFDVSIDRITIMGNILKEDVDKLKSLISETSAFDLWGITSTAQGLIFDRVFFSYDPLKAQAMNRRNFRMEFNPNSINDLEKKWLLENIIPMLTDKGLSRLDVAFDCDYNLSKLIYIQESPTKRNYYESRSGEIETLYLGTRLSEKLIRVYNKAVEIAEKKKKIQKRLKKDVRELTEEEIDEGIQDWNALSEIERPIWWRFEFELKRDKINLDDSLFEGLLITIPIINSITVPKVQDRAMLTYLKDNPDEWSSLSSATKTKYRKMLKELDKEIEDNITEKFKKALEEKRNDLLEQVARWIGVQPDQIFIEE